jgi:hypothetical protein
MPTILRITRRSMGRSGCGMESGDAVLHLRNRPARGPLRLCSVDEENTKATKEIVDYLDVATGL